MTSNQPVRAIPEGYPTVAPWVITTDTAAFIAFAEEVFGAESRFPPMHEDDTSRIEHAEIQIGDSVVLLFDREPGWGPTSAFLNVYVPDCDEAHRRALAAGAAEITPLSTNAWGDRGSRLADPFGNLWWVQTHVEDVSEADMVERMGHPEHVADLQLARDTLSREMRRRAT